jgi:hypothetical protein
MARASGLAALVVFLASSAFGAEPGREEHRVDFEAKEVQIAGGESELSLAGDVVVRSERFRLTADAVTLSRSPRGVHVEGAGRLAFCRCKDPPITLGFASADLAPPTDVLLEHATLRVFGVPIFYSPYLWLRAPTQRGVLPPTFEYRGEEGVFVGTGLHWPFERPSAAPAAPGAERPSALLPPALEAPRRAVADLSAGVYVAGGAAVRGDVRGRFGSARLGWDYFDGSAWDARADFAHTSEHAAVLAGNLRLLRGARALVAPASMEEVAMRADRARIGVGNVERSLFGLSVIAASERGAPLDRAPVVGPLLELGKSVALGSRGLGRLWLETEALRASAGPVSASAFGGELSAAVPSGPVLTDLWLRERTHVLTEEAGSALSVDGEARARVALPLARRFGALVHRVEPVVEGAVGTRQLERSGSLVSLEDPTESERTTVLGGIETALGTAREALELRVMTGIISAEDAAPAVLATRVRVSTHPVDFAAEARALPERRAVEVFARARAGRSDSAQALLHVEARRRNVSGLERLFYDDFLSPGAPWLREAGASAGGSVLFPWGFGLRSELGVELDLVRERLLGGTGAVGYRHVCDCLGIAVLGSKRIGRESFDVALRVDLVP